MVNPAGQGPEVQGAGSNDRGHVDGRLTQKGLATRSRLMDAAQEQLLGSGSVEIAGVARSAGVAQSVIHRYFGSKAGLVRAVVNRFYDEYDGAVFLAARPRGDTWLEREEDRIRLEVRFLYEHPLGPKIASGLLHDSAATQVDAERQRAHAAMAAKNIRKGQHSGELAADVDPELAGAAIIGALRATLAAGLGMPAPVNPEAVGDVVVCLGRALLSPPAQT